MRCDDIIFNKIEQHKIKIDYRKLVDIQEYTSGSQVLAARLQSLLFRRLNQEYCS
jgi:hypothetical protein